MKMDTKLTESGAFVPTAGLAVVEDYDEDVPVARYSTDTLRTWVNELEEIDSNLEVSIQETADHAPDDAPYGLVARVPDTDIVCFAAPLTNDLGHFGDDEDDESDGSDGRTLREKVAEFFGWSA